MPRRLTISALIFFCASRIHTVRYTEMSPTGCRATASERSAADNSLRARFSSSSKARHEDRPVRRCLPKCARSQAREKPSVDERPREASSGGNIRFPIATRVRADLCFCIDMTKPKPRDQLQKRGRKSAFRPEYILIAKACARFGAIEDEIANELNIGPATLDRWKQKCPEFRCALKAGKEASDDRVERSLYQLAIGWNGQPPNATACIFWLKNRCKDRWRDVQQLDSTIGHYLISDRPMTEEEWIEQRTKVIEAEATDGQALAEADMKPEDDTAKPLD
jgi:hypothetical protein